MALAVEITLRRFPFARCIIVAIKRVEKKLKRVDRVRDITKSTGLLCRAGLECGRLSQSRFPIRKGSLRNRLASFTSEGVSGAHPRHSPPLFLPVLLYRSLRGFHVQSVILPASRRFWEGVGAYVATFTHAASTPSPSPTAFPASFILQLPPRRRSLNLCSNALIDGRIDPRVA